MLKKITEIIPSKTGERLLAVLSSNTEDKPMVLIDASQNEGAPDDATIEEAETTVVAASKVTREP